MAAVAHEEVQFDVNDARRLREQAQRLNVRADQLRAELMATLADARALDNEAASIERAILERRATRDAGVLLLGDRVCAQLKRRAQSVQALADEFAVSPLRMRAVLKRLQADGRVHSTGVTRSTLWHATEPEAEPDRAGEPVTLRVFTKTTPERELADRDVAWTTEAPARADA